jgi:hypothetical protein
MVDVLQHLVQLLLALWDLVVAVLALLVPWTPLAAWVAFWLYAVDWVKLREIIVRGGWIGLVLLGVMAAFLWGLVAPPESGAHHLLGLTVSNFVGKLIYVTSLLVIMQLCGSVQLAGLCGRWASFPEDAPEAHADHGGHAGGHGEHPAGHGGHPEPQAAH